MPPLRRWRRRPHAGLVLAVVLVCQLMVVLDATIVNIALPDIAGALHFSTASLSWVVNAYTLVFGGMLLLGARAGDLLGRRRVLIAGVALFSAASLVGGLATGAGALLAARAAQGVGAALASPSALALLMTMFPGARERTRALGYYTAVSIGGSAVGLIAGGMLTQWLTWRWVLFVNVPIGAAVVALAALVLPETARRPGRFDLTGAASSTIGVGALVFGFVHAATAGWRAASTVAAFVAGLVVLAAFVRTELRAPAPITPLRLFRNRNRVASYLARLLLVAGMMGMFFFLTQFLQGVLGYSPLRTGVAFLPLTAALFASSTVSARVLMERFSSRSLMVVGLTASTAGLGWLTWLSQDSSYLSLLGPLVVFGLGNGLAFVPLTSLSLDQVDPADAGAASGLVNVMQQVGGSLGLAVLVTVFGAASRHAALDQVPGANAIEQAQNVFVAGADRGFQVATLLLAAATAVLAVAVRRPTTPTPASVGADEPASQPAVLVD